MIVSTDNLWCDPIHFYKFSDEKFKKSSHHKNKTIPLTKSISARYECNGKTIKINSDGSTCYMLEHDSASKEYDICHYWYFLDRSFKYEPYLCNGCYDLMQKVMNL